MGIDDKLIDDFIDIMADSGNEEDAQRNFAMYMLAKRDPQRFKSYFMSSVKSVMEKDVVDVVGQHSDADQLILGLMIKASIAANVDFFKNNELFRRISGLSKIDYDKLIDSVAIDVLNECFE